MITQYAAASLVSENKTLAHPSSVDSIPSSANQEDHVSMGTTAARHAYQIIQNSTKSSMRLKQSVRLKQPIFEVWKTELQKQETLFKN